MSREERYQREREREDRARQEANDRQARKMIKRLLRSWYPDPSGPTLKRLIAMERRRRPYPRIVVLRAIQLCWAWEPMDSALADIWVPKGE